MNVAQTNSGTPGQTIVIDRREKGGFFRRLGSTLLIFSLIMNFVLISKNAKIGAGSLDETYVAGAILPGGPKIANVEVKGAILDGIVDHAIKQVRQARDDKNVKAIVVRVDSPGGTVAGSDQIFREIEILKETTNKPVVVSMGNLAASGGYYISAPADHVFAEPTSWTGSIGVIMELPQIEKLLKTYGVDFTTIATGEWKDSGSPFRAMTDKEKTRWRGIVDVAYQRFVRIVAQGRKIPLKQVYELADGKVYTADEAKDLKLVDEIGYLEDAIEKAKTLAKLTTFRVVRYSKEFDLESLLLGASTRKKSTSAEVEDMLTKLRTPVMMYMMR
jgi:protease-4